MLTANDEYDETFDEKTFQIQLRARDPELRRATLHLKRKLERLARMRARNENIAFDDAWDHIFDVARMRADLHCGDDRRAALAGVIWDGLAALEDRREKLTEATRVAHGGSHAA
ncbi:MAG TPA: hypothetical protein VFQ53_04655 [Kofleriaceae bacterium]|nr:hypothetical protein [Kofleriaceae bacterium]